MGARRTDVRERMVGVAAGMLARHGLNATSIRELAKRADAPLGSTYHHFPEGKGQVIAEAIELARARATAGLDMHLSAGAVAGLDGFLALWRGILIRNEFRTGCPVLAAAVEEPIDEPADDARHAAAAAFDEWEGRFAEALVRDGAAPASASALATLIVASFEGAIALCRARRRIEPFDRVAAQLQVLVARCIEEGVARG